MTSTINSDGVDERQALELVRKLSRLPEGTVLMKQDGAWLVTTSRDTHRGELEAAVMGILSNLPRKAPATAPSILHHPDE